MNWFKKYYLFRVALFIFFLVFCGCLSGQKTQEQTVPWKFAVVSDTQGNRKIESDRPYINEDVLTMIAADIVQEKPEFVLVAGDLVNGWLHNNDTDYPTQFAVWKEVMSPVYDAGIRVYPIRGNHEDGPERFALSPLRADLEPPEGSQEALKSAFIDAFGQDIPRNGPEGEVGFTYSFTYKNALIIGLDEYILHQHMVNQAWLDEQLASKIEAHLFVFGHEPAYSVNHKDNLSFYQEDRDLFWDAIGGAGGRVYFCGHDHMYNRAAVSDSAGNVIRQVVMGTGGGTQREWSGEYPDETGVTCEYHMEGVYGYVLVMVDGPTATIEWKTATEGATDNGWKVLDTFSYDLYETTFSP